MAIRMYMYYTQIVEWLFDSHYSSKYINLSLILLIADYFIDRIIVIIDFNFKETDYGCES